MRIFTTHLNDNILEELVPSDMKVPTKRLELCFSNISWLCRNIMIQNKHHPEIKQTLAKLNTLRMKILLKGND